MMAAWQIVVRDDANASGASVAEMIRKIHAVTGCEWLAVGGVEGAGGEIRRLAASATDLRTLTVAEMLDMAAAIVQLDWGDFYFCRSSDDAARILGEDDYSVSILRAVVLMRIVDDTYYYIYGADLDVRDALLKRVCAESVRIGAIAALDFPE